MLKQVHTNTLRTTGNCLTMKPTTALTKAPFTVSAIICRRHLAKVRILVVWALSARTLPKWCFGYFLLLHSHISIYIYLDNLLENSSSGNSICMNSCSSLNPITLSTPTQLMLEIMAHEAGKMYTYVYIYIYENVRAESTQSTILVKFAQKVPKPPKNLFFGHISVNFCPILKIFGTVTIRKTRSLS